MSVRNGFQLSLLQVFLERSPPRRLYTKSALAADLIHHDDGAELHWLVLFTTASADRGGHSDDARDDDDALHSLLSSASAAIALSGLPALPHHFKRLGRFGPRFPPDWCANATPVLKSHHSF